MMSPLWLQVEPSRRPDVRILCECRGTAEEVAAEQMGQSRTEHTITRPSKKVAS